MPLSAVRPIEEAWNASRNLIAASGGDPLPPPAMNGADSILVTAALLTLIILFYQSVSAVAGSYYMVTSDNRRRSLFNDTGYKVSAMICLAILTPVFSWMLVKSGISSVGFWRTFAATAAFILYHPAILAIVAWVHGKGELLSLNHVLVGAMVLLMAISLPIGLFFALLHGVSPIVPSVLAALAAALCLIPYYRCAAAGIAERKFSLLFNILYICGLEILPLAVLIRSFAP